MRIAVVEPLGAPRKLLDELAAPLRVAGHEVCFESERSTDVEILRRRAEGAAVVILANIPFGGDLIRALPELRMLSVAFTGTDHVDCAACRERGIWVCNAAGYATQATAEMTIALMLGALRCVAEGDRVVRQGGVRTYLGKELRGRKVGIVGTGAIGLRVAELLLAFGCEVVAWSRSIRKEALALGVTYVDLDELLATCDIVSLHTPLTEETKLLFDRERIARMKPGSLLLNVSRGGVVDSHALAVALEEGHLKGAGIDVFEMEPPIPADHPLLAAPNTLLAPHGGFATEEALAKRARIVFENVTAWLEGHPSNVVVRGRSL
ncbi:NAD(P)-dependent oxidoreductase [Aminiphilus sp.]|uniref:NAD(P)-dependent oxidoreductase n=1 Tax=Aminiphilus sp. TaxID=1872488 RepID=UPI002637441A|nr:NAD(P)-dependent oxidoreductase [Aminiphilus sp.]